MARRMCSFFLNFCLRKRKERGTSFCCYILYRTSSLLSPPPSPFHHNHLQPSLQFSILPNKVALRFQLYRHRNFLHFLFVFYFNYLTNPPFHQSLQLSTSFTYLPLTFLTFLCHSWSTISHVFICFCPQSLIYRFSACSCQRIMLLCPYCYNDERKCVKCPALRSSAILRGVVW
jgi:hypothetical protein